MEKNLSTAATLVGQSELSRHKLLLVSAAIGLTTSMNVALFYSLGSFIGPLQAEFGWDRGSISFAATLLTCGIFIFGPVVGRLCDRYGAAKVGSLSLVAHGLGLIVIAGVVNSLPLLWGGYFLIAMLGVGSTPIVLARPIASAFDKQRGLAIGIAMTGAGLAGYWVPKAVTAAISSMGWRAGYLALALAALIAAPLVWFGFRPYDRNSPRAARSEPKGSKSLHKTPLNNIAFWIAASLSFTMALGIGGTIVHLIPLFRDMGADPKAAASLASVIGISSAVARLLIGTCLDRFPAPIVSCVVLALGASGIAVLLFGGLGFALWAVVLIGFLLGAELDLLAYLASRLFDARVFASVYGWIYGIYAIGFGISPFIIGGIRDRTGNYDVSMIASIACLGLAAAIALGTSSQMPGRRDDAQLQ